MSAPESAPLAPRDGGRFWRKLALAVASLLALIWLFGAVGFLRADGVARLTLPRRATPPKGEHNLASYLWGPTLRASSYYREPSAHHHPAFLVDEREDPGTLEKWASTFRDRRPWVEVEWREPRSVTRVVLRHAGYHEDSDMTLNRYTLRCLGEGEQPELKVSDNHDDMATHKLACRAARGVRATFYLKKADDMARLYELEVWGQ